MSYCSNCGKLVGGYNKAANSTDSGSLLWAVLGFFLPFIGLILYLLWKNDQPRNAQAAGKGALIGFIVSIVTSIIFITAFGFIFAELSFYF
jgi:uncharacterized protein YqgC (DUF456 family)